MTKPISLSLLGVRVVKEKTEEYDLADKRMHSPVLVVDLLHEVFEIGMLTQEIMVMLTLDTKNTLTGIFEISRGTLNSSIVHPRDVYQRAILQNANSIILAHNHPSGDPDPSNEDIQITDRLKQAGDLLGIKVLDHVIIGGTNRYISFKEKNLI